MLKNFFRKLFCLHDWELVKEIKLYPTYLTKENDYPSKIKCIYFCKKCGKIYETKIEL